MLLQPFVDLVRSRFGEVEKRDELCGQHAEDMVSSASHRLNRRDRLERNPQDRPTRRGSGPRTCQRLQSAITRTSEHRGVLKASDDAKRAQLRNGREHEDAETRGQYSSCRSGSKMRLRLPASPHTV
eukprot:3759164-Rhodomonas_salina.1